MLRDEAIEMLLERLDEQAVGSVTIRVDHGRYVVSFDTRYIEIEGPEKPVLSDALAGLIEVLA